MQLDPFAVYLIKTGQLLCSALGMEDKHLMSYEQFTKALEPKSKGEEPIRELNGVELESCIMLWSASHYANQNSRHSQWSPPKQKLVMDLLTVLQRVQFWHLAEWIHATGRETSQYWGIRRHANAPIWVTREPNQQEKLLDGIAELHESLGINILSV